MMVFGLGSGRCGTNSLARILNHQDGVLCFHEANPSAMAWHGAEQNVLATINQFHVLMSHGISTITTDLSVPDRSAPLQSLDPRRPPYCVGDIALYYLPYVEFILDQTNEVRFPCLRRDREKTIMSFRRKLQTSGYSNITLLKYFVLGRSTLRNPWSDGSNATWRCDPTWNRLFRKSGLQSKPFEDYVSEWYDFYYETASSLQAKFPEYVRIFDTDDLNSEQGQLDILKFSGIDTTRASFVRAHTNTSAA